MAFLVYNFETKVLSTRDKKEEINLDEEMYVGLEDKDDEFYVMQVDGVDIGDNEFQLTTLNEFDKILNDYISMFGDPSIEKTHSFIYSQLNDLNIEKTFYFFDSDLCSFTLHKIKMNRNEWKPCFK